MRGWVIDRDYLAKAGDSTRVGYGQRRDDALATAGQVVFRQVFVERGLKASEVEDPIRWRALDDDGEVYYGGALTAGWLLDATGIEDLAYGICEFVAADAGATCVQFKAADVERYDARFAERHREIGCTVKAGGTEWVVVY